MAEINVHSSREYASAYPRIPYRGPEMTVSPDDILKAEI